MCGGLNQSPILFYYTQQEGGRGWPRCAPLATPVSTNIISQWKLKPFTLQWMEPIHLRCIEYFALL